MNTTQTPQDQRDDQIGRAHVEDTPELLEYYRDLEKYETGALCTVANSIEPWEPTYAALQNYATTSDGSLHDGVMMEYVNPTTNWPVMRSLGLYREEAFGDNDGNQPLV